MTRMAAAPALSVVKARWRAVAMGAACFVAAYHALLLVTLVLRFGHWPNYVTLHDWPRNVARIVRSTPAVTDMAPIILDEWLLEVGYMNHDYGFGIAEWSLTILPAKLAMVTLVALLVSIDLVALHAAADRCSVGRHPYGAGLAIGTGAALSGFASTTMTWIVCCAAPSWAVTLSMLGVGVSTALWLEPLGAWLNGAGFGLLLLGSALLLGCLTPRLDQSTLGQRGTSPVLTD